MEPAKLDFEPSTGVRNRTACSHGISANLISERRASASSVRNPWLDQVGKVLETLNQGVVISDEDKRIVFANSMFLEMGNMSAESIIGRSVMDLYPPANLAGCRNSSGAAKRRDGLDTNSTFPKQTADACP